MDFRDDMIAKIVVAERSKYLLSVKRLSVFSHSPALIIVSGVTTTTAAATTTTTTTAAAT